jgi:hypothetical protein
MRKHKLKSQWYRLNKHVERIRAAYHHSIQKKRWQFGLWRQNAPHVQQPQFNLLSSFSLLLRISLLSIPIALLIFANSQIPIWAMQLGAAVQPTSPVTTAQVAGVTTSTPTTNVPSSQKLTVQELDKRAYVLNEYFRINNSPLQGTGEIMVRKCLEFGAPRDCTIVAAIARAETDLCKYHASGSYFNCWGFGGAGPNRIRFTSWEQSIDRVYRSLAFSYGPRYILNPSLMERRFCGSEPGCTGWGRRVQFFVYEIDQLSISMGFGSMLALR